MNSKEEPSTYIVDDKKPEYYRNQSLNNCAARNRILIKINNHVAYIRSMVSELKILEETKDFHLEHSKNLEDLSFFLNNAIDCFENYSEEIKAESNKLKSLDFEDIIKKTIVDIKSVEKDKNCTEVK